MAKGWSQLGVALMGAGAAANAERERIQERKLRMARESAQLDMQRAQYDRFTQLTPEEVQRAQLTNAGLDLRNDLAGMQGDVYRQTMDSGIDATNTGNVAQTAKNVNDATTQNALRDLGVPERQAVAKQVGTELAIESDEFDRDKIAQLVKRGYTQAQATRMVQEEKTKTSQDIDKQLYADSRVRRGAPGAEARADVSNANTRVSDNNLKQLQNTDATDIIETDWMNGVRAEQALTRKNMAKIEREKVTQMRDMNRQEYNIENFTMATRALGNIEAALAGGDTTSAIKIAKEYDLDNDGNTDFPDLAEVRRDNDGNIAFMDADGNILTAPDGTPAVFNYRQMQSYVQRQDELNSAIKKTNAKNNGGAASAARKGSDQRSDYNTFSKLQGEIIDQLETDLALEESSDYGAPSFIDKFPPSTEYTPDTVSNIIAAPLNEYLETMVLNGAEPIRIRNNLRSMPDIAKNVFKIDLEGMQRIRNNAINQLTLDTYNRLSTEGNDSRYQLSKNKLSEDATTLAAEEIARNPDALVPYLNQEYIRAFEERINYTPEQKEGEQE